VTHSQDAADKSPVEGVKAEEAATKAVLRVGFGKALGDHELVRVLSRHTSTKPIAALMWSNGLSGTFRSYESYGSTIFLQTARAQAIEHFRLGLGDANRLIADFLQSNSNEQIASNSALQVEGRSLLTLKQQYRQALADALAGHELFYALEVEGPPHHIDQLRNDEAIRAIQDVDTDIRSKSSKTGNLKPLEYTLAFYDPEIDTIDASELRQRLVLERDTEY
jgi:hypothetical protein